jgi:hypothetical protein
MTIRGKNGINGWVLYLFGLHVDAQRRESRLASLLDVVQVQEEGQYPMSRGRVGLVIRRIVMPTVELNSAGGTKEWDGEYSTVSLREQCAPLAKASMRISQSRGHLKR